MTRFVVGRVAEFPENGRKIVDIDGRKIIVFRIGAEWFGLSNICPHQGGSLCAGKQISSITSRRPGEYTTSRHGEILRCPWHGWEFDIRTGASICRPENIRTRTFDVSVAPDETGESVTNAETFTVEEEGNLVVVTM